MDTPTTPPIDLGAIEARLSAATPGPWWQTMARTLLHVTSETRHIVSLSVSPPRVPEPEIREQHALRVHADADLIAHAPEDLRVLLAEVRRLRADTLRARVVGLQEAAAFLGMAAEKMEAGGIEDAPAGDVVAALIEGLMARAADGFEDELSAAAKAEIAAVGSGS